MFGERLKHLRTEAGLSQKALAAKLFISQQAVAQWELEKGSPNPETLSKIAEILNVSADYLLGRTDQKEMPTPVSEDGHEHSEYTQRFMDLVDRLTPDQQQLLFVQLQAWTAQNQLPLSAAQGSEDEKAPKSDS